MAARRQLRRTGGSTRGPFRGLGAHAAQAAICALGNLLAAVAVRSLTSLPNGEIAVPAPGVVR
jgi:hypothetical protein